LRERLSQKVEEEERKDIVEAATVYYTNGNVYVKIYY
jgi:hypothetical protein